MLFRRVAGDGVRQRDPCRLQAVRVEPVIRLQVHRSCTLTVLLPRGASDSFVSAQFMYTDRFLPQSTASLPIADLRQPY